MRLKAIDVILWQSGAVGMKARVRRCRHEVANIRFAAMDRDGLGVVLLGPFENYLVGKCSAVGAIRMQEIVIHLLTPML